MSLTLSPEMASGLLGFIIALVVITALYIVGMLVAGVRLGIYKARHGYDASDTLAVRITSKWFMLLGMIALPLANWVGRLILGG